VDMSRTDAPLPPAPDRLRTLVEDDQRNPIQQPPVILDYQRWSKRLVDHEEVLRSLPRELTRENVREFALGQPDDPAGAAAAFIASQIWGYGSTGYGPFRLAEALKHPQLPDALQEARSRLRHDRPVDAFRVLCVDHQIPWTGTSFGTKYLFAVDPHGRALILDRFVAEWLERRAGLRLRDQRSEREYATWLAVAESWARGLGVDRNRLEMLIFTDGLGARSSWRPGARSSWKPSYGGATRRDVEAEPAMTAVQAIVHVLRDMGLPMRAGELADEINRRGIYSRRDGNPLPAYQVSSAVHANPLRFRTENGLVSLIDADVTDPPAAQPRDVAHAAEPVCVLIGCVSRKEPTARPAKDLYRTELFSRRRAYAEASGRPWLIVSALYGIVDPDAVIEPYDVRISDLDRHQRQALAEQIADDLEQRFGPLAGVTFEVHAGDEYMQMLAYGLRPRRARLVNPLRGLRIGEQLAWYGQRRSAVAASTTVTDGSGATSGIDRQPRHLDAHPPRLETAPRHPGLAREITEAFQVGALDLTERMDAPPTGWAGMPEVAVAERMRSLGASGREIRCVLTFTAAMDRARDADALWFAAQRMFEEQPWTFAPELVVHRSLTELADVLRRYRVSQRHGVDVAGWRVIAESLADPEAAREVRKAVIDGQGDARNLLHALQAISPAGTDRFPFLRGPKVGPMWVRMIAHPGGGEIEALDVLPVAVDVQVRKVTEYLGVADTGNLKLDVARPVIQAAWARDVAESGAAGPGDLDGTAAALDPALWFWAKWGCTRCERVGRRVPIGTPCGSCRFPARA
jgi:hypothetical protein